MNAVGVKADASGYPTKGGTGGGDPVRLFRPDDRLLWRPGAMAGATIHSPGEYTSLKAGS